MSFDITETVICLAALFAAGAAYTLHGKVDGLRREIEDLQKRLSSMESNRK